MGPRAWPQRPPPRLGVTGATSRPAPRDRSFTRFAKTPLSAWEGSSRQNKSPPRCRGQQSRALAGTICKAKKRSPLLYVETFSASPDPKQPATPAKRHVKPETAATSGSRRPRSCWGARPLQGTLRRARARLRLPASFHYFRFDFY